MAGTSRMTLTLYDENGPVEELGTYKTFTQVDREMTQRFKLPVKSVNKVSYGYDITIDHPVFVLATLRKANS